MKRPKANQIFRHFKGNLYKIITVATHTETEEEMVVYQALYGDYQSYVRPLSMFMEELDPNQYPEALQKYRFQLLEEIAYADEEKKEALPKEATVDIAEAEVCREGEEKLDPLLEAYLDADNYKERREILESLRYRITDHMITTMAMAADLEIPEGDLEERFLSLRNCLITREKYESTRLR